MPTRRVLWYPSRFRSTRLRKAVRLVPCHGHRPVQTLYGIVGCCERGWDLRKLLASLVVLSSIGTAHASGHFVYIPVYTGGYAVNPEHAVGNAEASKDADTPEFKAFLGCDGFGRVTGDSDEVNRLYVSTWLTKGSHFNLRYQTQPKLGAEGVAACTRALADPALDDRFATRRVQLLLYRALHQINVGDIDAAQADVDAANALLKPLAGDTVVQRALGVDARIVGAYAAFANDDKAASAELVRQVLAARPFAIQAIYLAPALQGWMAKDGDGLTWQKRLARQVPQVRQSMAFEALVMGRFADFNALLPLLSDDYLTNRDIKTLAENDGIRAYTWAAVGRQAEADALIAQARAYIAAHTPELMPSAADGVKEGRKQADERARILEQRIAGQAAAIGLNKWADRIALRGRIARAGLDEFGTLNAQAMTETQIWVRFDYQRLLATRLPKAAPPTPVPPTPVAPPPIQIPAAGTTDLQDTNVLHTMLHAESWGLIPQGRTSGPDATGFPWGGFKWINGGSCNHSDIGPTTHMYTCTNDSNAPDVIGETVLINAALDARKAGKTGLVIRNQRTTRHVYQGLNNGYDVTMHIDFVDRAALPEAFKPIDWAVIGVDEVLTALMPFYARPETRS